MYVFKYKLYIYKFKKVEIFKLKRGDFENYF